MKKYLIILCLQLLAIQNFAQKKIVQNLTTFDDRQIHFGFLLGVNTMDYSISHFQSLYDNPKFSIENVNSRYVPELDSVGFGVRSDVKDLTPGFTVGMVSNLRLGRYFDLRFTPGLSFGNRKLVFNVPIHDLNAGKDVSYYSVRSTYLDFPLSIRYKTMRLNNQSVFLTTGTAMRYDISRASHEDLIRQKKVSFYAEFGIGLDSYLQFFRFSTELKISFGLNNALNSAPEYPNQQYYNYSIKRLSPDLVTLIFYFE